MKFRLIKSRSIAERMFGVIVPMILVPIIMLSLVEYAYTRRVMDENAKAYLASVAGVTVARLQDSIDNVQNVAFFVNGNEDIQNYIEQGIRQKDGTRVEKYDVYDSIVGELTHMSLLRKEINGIHIISIANQRYSYWKNKNSFEEKEIDYFSMEDDAWYCDADSVLYVKKMYAYPSHEILGAQIVDIDTSGLYGTMSEISLNGNGSVYLVDENGMILASDDVGLIGKNLSEDLIGYVEEEEVFHRAVYVNGVMSSVYSSKALSNGWTILLTIPREVFRRDIARIRNVTILASLFLALFAVIGSRVIAKQSTMSIMQLKQAMDDFAQGDFEVHCEVNDDNEIGDLARSFNTMVDDINELVNTVYEQKLMKQKAQMESLQLQINPHFLYNTLDTINWMARMKGADEIGDMVAALGNLMRYSLGKKSFVTLGEEIKNLEDYLHIQTFRYGDKMEAVLEVDESLYSLYVPRLLIQPILENAIVHGLEDKLDEGHIKVYATRQEEDLDIVVEDDGVGMTEEAILRIFDEGEKARKKGHTSVGVVNVNKRIQMIYGADYGISIQSVLGAGTKMTLHLKAMTQDPEMLKY